MTKPTPFPERGQIWEATEGCEVRIQYLFNAPITFDGTARLAAGERVCVTGEVTDPRPTVVGFLPIRYAELHDSLVTPDLRNTPRYQAYALLVDAGYFLERFRRVE